MQKVISFYKSKLIVNYIFVLIIVIESFANNVAANSLIDSLSVSKRNSSFIILPYVSHSIDTRLSVGIISQIYGLPKKIIPILSNKNDSLERASIIEISGEVTQNKQFNIYNFYDIYPGDGWKHLIINFNLAKETNSFYELGNESKIESKSKFTEIYLHANFKYYLNVNNEISLGTIFDYRHNRMNEKFTEPSLSIFQTGKHWNSIGGGLSFLFDNRDNTQFTTRGSYLNIELEGKFRIDNSFLPYYKLSFDYRNNANLKKNHILSFQVAFESVGENAPLQLSPSIGKYLRGFEKYRFIDNNLMIIQTEYKFPFLKRFNGVIFGGVGNVYDYFNTLSFDNLKHSVGLGLRYKVLKSSDARIRFDYAFTNEGSSIVLGFNEAF